ncbi:MAG: electron transport complex subunit E [Endomicrobiales bacterium]|nr:electron transport complex subunit E [Endomicrobiales bacterium]
MQKWRDIFLNGIVKENPILILMIGLCPVLACSSTATDAFGMGVAATFVLLCSNILVSLLRKLIPTEIRIPIFIVIIATFVTITDYTMQAYFPQLSENLGVFVPLIVVNCVILGRAEAFAYRNTLLASILDGLGMGVGFTLAIVLLGIIREILGAGTVFNVKIGISNPATLLILPPGAFIGIGVLIAVWNALRKSKGSVSSPCASCGLRQMCHSSKEGECEALGQIK